MEAVTYIRKSKKRSTDQVNSHHVQLQAITDFAEMNGIELVNHFQDSATGKNNERQGWKNLLNCLSENKELNLVVYRVDRLARNFGVLQDLEPLVDAGRVYVVENGPQAIDSQTLALFLMMAKRESANISARTRATYKLLKAKADKSGVPLKWGTPDGKTLSQLGRDASQREVLRTWEPIFRFCYEDISFTSDYCFKTGKPKKKALLALLNRNNFTTRRGNPITYQAFLRAEGTWQAVYGMKPFQYYQTK